MRDRTPGPLQSDDTGLAWRALEPVPARPSGLLILLHGVGADELSLAPLAASVAEDMLVLLVRAPLTLGPQRYGWFPVSFATGEPVIDADAAEASRLALIRFIEAIRHATGITPERTRLAGFSQGGIMSASVALTAPHLLGGFAILSGRILPEIAARIAPRERLAHLDAFICHGEDDDKLPVMWAERSTRWLERLGIRHRLVLDRAPHALSPRMQAAFIDWVAGSGAPAS